MPDSIPNTMATRSNFNQSSNPVTFWPLPGENGREREREREKDVQRLTQMHTLKPLCRCHNTQPLIIFADSSDGQDAPSSQEVQRPPEVLQGPCECPCPFSIPFESFTSVRRGIHIKMPRVCCFSRWDRNVCCALPMEYKGHSLSCVACNAFKHTLHPLCPD